MKQKLLLATILLVTTVFSSCKDNDEPTKPFVRVTPHELTIMSTKQVEHRITVASSDIESVLWETDCDWVKIGNKQKLVIGHADGTYDYSFDVTCDKVEIPAGSALPPIKVYFYIEGQEDIKDSLTIRRFNDEIIIVNP